jgi:glycosyltransferase involved in cell wall biosynthesis
MNQERFSERLPKRILMTADPIGGVWTYALELASALRENGVEVCLATMGAPLTAQQERQAMALGNVQIHESRFKLEWMEEPWDDVAAAGEWLLDLEQRLQPEIIHLNGYAHGALPWSAPVLVAAHSCVCSWWKAVHQAPAPSAWDRYRTAVSAGLRAADLVVAPSQGMIDGLCESYAPIPQPEVIYNGRALSLGEDSAKERMVLAAGRLWDEAKNLRALAAVAERLPWPVCLAGDAQAPGEKTISEASQNSEGNWRFDDVRLENDRAESEGCAQAGGLRFLGRLAPEELRRWFSRASIYALPARYEPFGLSALEAGLAGCALVLGDIPTLREVWGDAALFVPPSDTEFLRNTLLDLMFDSVRLHQMASRARTRALEFTPRRMADSYLRVYGRLLRLGTGRTAQRPSADDLPEPAEARATGSLGGPSDLTTQPQRWSSTPQASCSSRRATEGKALCAS